MESATPNIEGVVEEQFIYPLVLGENVLPFRLLAPARAVLPFASDGKQVDPAFYPDSLTGGSRCHDIGIGIDLAL